jgi:hypothetical protein
MAKDSQDIVIKVSAQRPSYEHHGGNRDDVEADKDVLRNSIAGLQAVDELH